MEIVTCFSKSAKFYLAFKAQILNYYLSVSITWWLTSITFRNKQTLSHKLARFLFYGPYIFLASCLAEIQILCEKESSFLSLPYTTTRTHHKIKQTWGLLKLTTKLFPVSLTEWGHLVMPLLEKNFHLMSSFIAYEITYANKYAYAQTKRCVNTSFWLSSYKAFPLKLSCWISV